MKRRGDVNSTGTADKSRRDALVLIAAAAAASAPVASHVPVGDMESAILAVFGNRVAAGRLGHAVLAALPASAGRATLRGAILDDLALGDGDAARAGVDEIRARLSQRVRADFAAGRTRTVDGWVLSVTETHLYALAALVPVAG